MSLLRSSPFLIASFLSAALLVGQEPPRPGPEHEYLKALAGNWDATVSGPEMPPSKASAVYTMDLGGLWLTSSFEGDFGGAKFQGRGFDSYDAKKRKYVSVWVDSMSTSPMVFEGDVDPKTQTMTMSADFPGPDGSAGTWRSTTAVKSPDQHLFKMYFKPKAGGAETEIMTIEYKRKK